MQNELMEQYFETKDVPKRNKILKELIFNLPVDGEEFFYKAFKRERYLDMKLSAVRGYAAYASEEKVAVFMAKMLELLKKRPEHTPYDYEEYEIMRSSYQLPYLLKKYDYDCFRVFNEQLQKQYDAMPDVFKDIFSCDEFGNSYWIRDPKEVNDSFDKFYKEQGSR